MTTRQINLVLALLFSGCPLPAPPAPEPIECDEIERAEERFPEECADGDAGLADDAGPSDGEL